MVKAMYNVYTDVVDVLLTLVMAKLTPKGLLGVVYSPPPILFPSPEHSRPSVYY